MVNAEYSIFDTACAFFILRMIFSENRFPLFGIMRTATGR